MEKGTFVTYTGADGEHLALVLNDSGGDVLDLYVFPSSGDQGPGGFHGSVQRKDAEGDRGHTWRP